MNSLRLTWLLLALNLVVGFILLTVYFEELEPVSQAVAGPKPNHKIPTIPAYQTDTDNSYTAIMNHPLFNESRLPEEEPQESEITKLNTKQINASEFTLLGVVISPEETQALLQKKDRSIERVSLGERIDGWELKSVEAASVVLVNAGKNIQLTLERTSQTKTKTRRKPKRRAPTRRQIDD